YKEKNKDKLREQRKERYEKNKEKVAEQQKEYRETNKEEILRKKKGKIICDCGLETSKSHLARHKKTAKHKKLIDSVNEKKIIIT
ncbi:MAG: hypothetical protein HRT87_09695, partial [Legionellales bacterium]|nr:hypothetical protein [Legionellales bacterium]